MPVSDTKAATIVPIMVDTVQAGSNIYTDEFKVYSKLGAAFNHEFVRHSADEYVSGHVHTNNIECFWSLLKIGIDGIYHQVSPKHLGRYVNEFTFRYNNCKLSEGSKFDVALANGTNKRLSYKNLVHGK